MKKCSHLVKWSFLGSIILAWLVLANAVMAGGDSCLSRVDYVKPKDIRATRALYVLVDETAPLTDKMKKKIYKLVANWGKPGDQVKIARFSASYRGLYPELLFSRKLDPVPDDNFLFNLHYQDKKALEACMAKQKEDFQREFPKALKVALKQIDPKIPKTELLGSLKLLSRQVIARDDAKEKIVLLISDGLENSGVLSFYAKKLVKPIDAHKQIIKLRRKGLIGYWKNTKVYMYGLGLMPDKKHYSKPENILKLKRFWERYFVEGGGKVVEIGMPELLLTSID